jgi:hypothetical protein
MHFIEFFASKTANFLNDNLDKESIIRLSKIATKYRKKETDLTIGSNNLESLQYGLHAIYGEIFKTSVVLSIAALLHIFIPTYVVMLSFSILRAFIGGKHLHSSSKCLVFTSVLLLVTGLISSISYSPLLSNHLMYDTWFLRIVYYIAFGVFLEVISITKPFEWILQKINGVEK